MGTATECYGYVRVSGKGQVKGHGPRRQRELIEEFAARHAYRVVAFYEDSHTGTEADRPQFTEMLVAMMGNGVKTVIVESLDRLARDLMIQSTLLAKLAAEGLTLIAANTGMDVTAEMESDPMRRAMIQIQAVFAELDRRMTVKKLRDAREKTRAEKGRCEGRKPFGHYDGELAVLARIHKLHRKPRGGVRMSVREIAETLNAEGHRNRSGGLWTAAFVRRLIK